MENVKGKMTFCGQTAVHAVDALEELCRVAISAFPEDNQITLKKSLFIMKESVIEIKAILEEVKELP